MVSPPASAPATQIPSFFKDSIVCEIFVTLATGVYSTAPADVFATTELNQRYYV